MKNKKTFSELSLPLLITAIPTVMSSFFYALFGNLAVSWKNVILSITAYSLSFLIIGYIYKNQQRKDGHVKYKNIEGVWIQYIPDFPRKIAICELSFDGDQYHFDGTNFDNDGRSTVFFNSYMFIEDTSSSFFYVTSAHEQYKPKPIEGFGKVYNIERKVTGSYEAEGFFFDVSSALDGTAQKSLQTTFLFKLDEKFYKRHKKKAPYNIMEEPHEKIYNELGEYIRSYCETRNWRT